MDWFNHLFETWSWVESLALSFLYLLIGAFRGWLIVRDIEQIVEEEMEEIQKNDQEMREIQDDLKEQMEELEDLFGSHVRGALIIFITLFWLPYDCSVAWDWLKSRFAK